MPGLVGVPARWFERGGGHLAHLVASFLPPDKYSSTLGDFGVPEVLITLLTLRITTDNVALAALKLLAALAGNGTPIAAADCSTAVV